MRIISGKARGLKLYSLEGLETRPTLDRVKESLFNIIRNNIKDSNVLDLFAGTGSLGLECISRGAKSVTFCDYNKKAIDIINKNILKAKFEEKSQVINKDYIKCLEILKNNKYDIIFIDPPYDSDLAVKALELVFKVDILEKDGIIVVETDDEETLFERIEKIDTNVKEHIEIKNMKKYGRIKLIFINRKG